MQLPLVLHTMGFLSFVNSLTAFEELLLENLLFALALVFNSLSFGVVPVLR